MATGKWVERNKKKQNMSDDQRMCKDERVLPHEEIAHADFLYSLQKPTFRIYYQSQESISSAESQSFGKSVWRTQASKIPSLRDTPFRAFLNSDVRFRIHETTTY